MTHTPPSTLSMSPMKLNVIVFGATGMVGEGVAHCALRSPDVASVLVVARRSSGIVHPKVKELLVKDMFDLASVADQLSGYDACYFCLGTTSVGKKEDEYRRTTYDLTMNAARVLAARNPEMTFCYVSGAGTDGTEQGRTMWARVKGKTENDLRTVGFKKAYAFRPAFIKPMEGMKNSLPFTPALGKLYPLLIRLVPNFVGTLQEIGDAMLQTTIGGAEKTVLEVPDIRSLSREYRRTHAD